MTDSRTEFVDVLRDVIEMSPDVRLGQLMANLVYLMEGHAGRSPWDAEDEDVMAVLVQHRDDLVRVHRLAGLDVSKRVAPSEPSPRFMEILTEIVELSPDVRFGQMLAYFNDLIAANTGRSPWDAEDEEVLAVLERHLADLPHVHQPAE